jgi:hypothetical protein
MLVFGGAEPESGFALEEPAAPGAGHMADRHRHTIRDMNGVLRREEISKDPLLL